MTTYADMVPNIAVDVPMCPQPLIITALQKVAQDFFTQSKVWSETMDPLFVQPKVRDIEVEHPSGARIVAIRYASFGGADLETKTPFQLDREVADWRDTAFGDPKYLTMLSPDIIRLAPHPDTKGRLTIFVTLAPTLEAKEIPDAWAAEYESALEDGVKARLMAMPSKPWSNPQTAMYHKGEYQSAINTAFARQSKAFTGAKLRSRLEYR